MSNKIFIFTILGFIGVLSLSGCAKTSPTNTNVTANNTTTNTVGPTVTENKWIGLAKALTTAGAKFYGAYWCSHCNDQKKLFGDAIQYVPYVECAPDKSNRDKQSEACKIANIEGYPTWVFADGSRVEKVMTFDELANKIGYQDN